MYRVLVFEPDVEGHPREWLEHLVAYAAAAPDGVAVTFVVAAELCAALRARVPQAARQRIDILPLRTMERWMCTRRFLAFAAFARWAVMRRYLRLTGAQAGHFLSFDHLCLPLAMGLGMGARPVSGILFRPSVHYAELGDYRPSRMERVRDVRKALLYRLMLLNRDLRAVLSLDPYFAGYAARAYRGGDKVQTIPDPTHPAAVADESGMVPPNTGERRTRFVLFGYLTARKGLLVLLNALGRIDAATSSRISVVIAGRIDPALRGQVEGIVRRLRDARPGLQLHVNDKWLSVRELDGLIAASDVVLAPYQRFVGSSGVLLWAARNGLPLLTQDFGLIGRLVRDHGLGLTVDTTDAASLAAGMERMASFGPWNFVDVAAAQAFAASRTPHGFAAAVMRSLGCGEPRRSATPQPRASGDSVAPT